MAVLFTLIAASVVLAFVIVGGIAKCWSISRRPTTNAKCVMSLAVLLVGWLIQVVQVLLGLLVPLPSVVGSAFSWTSIGVTLAGGVLAIVGLQDYARRKGHFKQGRAQAIWALVLSSLLWFSILALLAEVKWGFTGIRASPAGAKVMVFPEKNLKFFAPGGRWQLVETNNLGWNGTVMLERERPRMSFVLIAGEETKEGYSVADLAEAGLESVRRKVSGLDVTFRAETRLGWWGGFHEGLRLTCEAGEAQQRLYLDQRFFFTNGWSYHLTTWGSKEDRKQISQEAADLFQRFELLDFRPKSVIATNAVNQSL